MPAVALAFDGSGKIIVLLNVSANDQIFLQSNAKINYSISGGSRILFTDKSIMLTLWLPGSNFPHSRHFLFTKFLECFRQNYVIIKSESKTNFTFCNSNQFFPANKKVYICLYQFIHISV